MYFKEKVAVMLGEYQTLKDEEKTTYSFEFTCISIWLAFLGVLIGTVLSQLNDLYEMIYSLAESDMDKFYRYLYDLEFLAEKRHLISFLLVVIVPGICFLFGICWLDLVTRFIKEAHYIFFLEENLRELLEDNKVIGYEHFVYEENRNKPIKQGFINKICSKIKLNYIYYCVMLGVQIICPIIAVFILFLNSDILPISDWQVVLQIVVFFVLLVFTIAVDVLYVIRIMSYQKDKENTCIIKQL